jgi:hypothetical protein
MHNYVLRFARDRATIIKMGGTQALWMTGANVAVFPADPTENRRSTMSRGYIYVLINPALQKNFLKIGKTTRTPEERARELSHGTNVPMPYMVAYEHLVADCDAAEARIHNALLPYRASADREFFVLPLHEALKSVMAICIEIGTASDSDTDDGSASPSTVVDAWLKPTEHGLQVAYDACFFPSLELVLSAANVVPSCRIDFGQPPTTLTTYDRKICIQGGTWEQALVRAQRADRKAQEYRSADLPFEVHKDIRHHTGGRVIAARGMQLGLTLGKHNWAEFERFWQVCKRSGLNKSRALVRLTARNYENLAGERSANIEFMLLSAFEGDD